jgi:hypothetical protein
VQVGLHRRGAGAEPRAIDLQVLHDTLHIVARLSGWDAFDPIDRINLGIARIAVLGYPFRDPATAISKPLLTASSQRQVKCQSPSHGPPTLTKSSQPSNAGIKCWILSNSCDG